MAARKRRRKSGKWKILLIVTGGIMAILVALFFYAGSYLTKNYITERIEEDINCRFELEKMDISLFSSNSSITLAGIKLAERDSFADDQTPHDDRPALNKAVVEIGKVELKVSLLDVIFRRLDVNQLLIEEAHANVTLFKDGTNSLDALLASPGEKEKDKKDSGRTFNVKSNSGFVTNLRHFEIVNCSANVIVESSKLQIQTEQFNLKLLDELRIDVDNLAKMEPSKWQMSTVINLFSGDGKMNYGKLSLDGEVEGIVFDAESGDLDPNIELTLGLGEDSYLKQIPVLQKVSDTFLDIQKLPWLGDISKKKWPETYFFKDHKSIHCKFEGSKYSFLSPVGIDLGEWSLQLEPNSWFQSTDATHEFVFHLYAGSTVSGLIEKSFGLMDKTPLPSKFKEQTDKIVGKLFADDERFFLKFKTTGKLAKPSAKLVSELPEIKNLKEMLRDEVERGVKNKLLDLLKN